MSEEHIPPQSPVKLQLIIQRLATSLVFAAVAVYLLKLSLKGGGWAVKTFMFAAVTGAMGAIIGKPLQWALTGILLALGFYAFLIALFFLSGNH